MVGASGFHGDFDCGLAQVHAVVGAVVIGFDDVGAMLGQNRREPVERAGKISQVDAQADQASIFDQAALAPSFMVPPVRLAVPLVLSTVRLLKLPSEPVPDE